MTIELPKDEMDRINVACLKYREAMIRGAINRIEDRANFHERIKTKTIKIDGEWKTVPASIADHRDAQIYQQRAAGGTFRMIGELHGISGSQAASRFFKVKRELDKIEKVHDEWGDGPPFPHDMPLWCLVHLKLVSIRAFNCVWWTYDDQAIKTIGDLVRADLDDPKWMRLPNFGRKCLWELKSLQAANK